MEIFILTMHFHVLTENNPQCIKSHHKLKIVTLDLCLKGTRRQLMVIQSKKKPITCNRWFKSFN